MTGLLVNVTLDMLGVAHEEGYTHFAETSTVLDMQSGWRLNV